MVFAVLNGLGKYPVAREALKTDVSDFIMHAGSWRVMAQVMPVGPGARRRVRLSNLLTSSSSKGVVRMLSGRRVFRCIVGSGSVSLCVLCMCWVMLLMCVIVGSCGGGV